MGVIGGNIPSYYSYLKVSVKQSLYQNSFGGDL